MTYLIIGASSGLGKDLVYEFASKGNNLIISSRDIRDLKNLKNDIELKYKVKVKILTIDLANLDDVKKKINLNNKFFDGITGVLFPAGQMDDEDFINLKPSLVGDLIFSNFISITYIISSYYQKKEKGIIVGFGSVSALFGRRTNPYYSASKRALESYFESLISNNDKKNINIQFYILGYLDTNLSFGKKLFLPRGSTKNLSKLVYKKRLLKNCKIYFPIWWSIIGFIINIIPFKILIFIFNFFKKNEKN